MNETHVMVTNKRTHSRTVLEAMEMKWKASDNVLWITDHRNYLHDFDLAENDISVISTKDELERDWYLFYTTFNDSNESHADSAFVSNKLTTASIQELHNANVDWYCEILKRNMSVKDIEKAMPTAKKYRNAAMERLNEELQTLTKNAVDKLQNEVEQVAEYENAGVSKMYETEAQYQAYIDGLEFALRLLNTETSQIIRSSNELIAYIIREYQKYDTELNSLFFDTPVLMKECDILLAYKEIQKRINGDEVVRLKDIFVDENGNITGDKAEDFIPEGKYQDLYTGNCKDFLESFNDHEVETGFCRFYDDEKVDFIF